VRVYAHAHAYITYTYTHKHVNTSVGCNGLCTLPKTRRNKLAHLILPQCVCAHALIHAHAYTTHTYTHTNVNTYAGCNVFMYIPKTKTQQITKNKTQQASSPHPAATTYSALPHPAISIHAHIHTHKCKYMCGVSKIRPNKLAHLILPQQHTLLCLIQQSQSTREHLKFRRQPCICNVLIPEASAHTLVVTVLFMLAGTLV
jgi:hypothetical protein